MFKGSSKLGLWGVIATIIYFLAIACLIFFTDYVEPNTLTLNELGDFFAGVFGPPALIWVVISFYLQSEELKNSVSALRLQAEELAKSVEQQIAMVELTRESISHDKVKFGLEEENRKANLRPIFEIQLTLSRKITAAISIYSMNIKNLGAQTTNTSIDFEGDLKRDGGHYFPEAWVQGNSHGFDVQLTTSEKQGPSKNIRISYIDSEGSRGEQVFNVDDSGNCTKITSP